MVKKIQTQVIIIKVNKMPNLFESFVFTLEII